MAIPRTQPVFGVGLDTMPRNAEEAKAFAKAKNRQAHEQAVARAAGHERQMRELGAMTKPKATAIDHAAVYRKLNAPAESAEDGTGTVLTLDDVRSAEPGTRSWRAAAYRRLNEPAQALTEEKPAAPSRAATKKQTLAAIVANYWSSR